MVIIINDNKKASGKTTTAMELLKGKNYIHLSSIMPLLEPTLHLKTFPEWVFIDGASQFDIDKAYWLQEKKFLEYAIKNKNEKRVEKVPNFVLITNEELQINIIK